MPVSRVFSGSLPEKAKRLSFGKSCLQNESNTKQYEIADEAGREAAYAGIESTTD
jgi:hypothetical protein